MDIAQAVELVTPKVAWRDASTYDRLVATWPADAGDPPSEAALQAAWDAHELATAKAAKSAELRAACEAAITAGVEASVLDAPHTYPTDRDSQINLIGLAMRAQVDGDADPSFPAAFWCGDASDQWARRAHTAQQLVDLGRIVIEHVKAQQTLYEDLLSQLEAATNIADTQAIAWPT